MNTTPIWIRQFCSFARVVKYSICPSMVVWQNRLYKRQPIREMTMTAINCQKLQVQSYWTPRDIQTRIVSFQLQNKVPTCFHFCSLVIFLASLVSWNLSRKIQSCRSKQKTNKYGYSSSSISPTVIIVVTSAICAACHEPTLCQEFAFYRPHAKKKQEMHHKWSMNKHARLHTNMQTKLHPSYTSLSQPGQHFSSTEPGVLKSYMYPTYQAAIVHICTLFFCWHFTRTHSCTLWQPSQALTFRRENMCMHDFRLSTECFLILFSSIIHFCKRSQCFRKLVVVAAATLSGSRSNSTPTHYNLLLLTSFRIVFVITFSHSVVYFVCRWSTTRLCACLIMFLLLLHWLTHTTCAE